jgi:hypothetical protein
MEWISDGVLPPANPDGFPVNDVDLLTAIENVLTSGCSDCKQPTPRIESSREWNLPNPCRTPAPVILQTWPA